MLDVTLKALQKTQEEIGKCPDAIGFPMEYHQEREMGGHLEYQMMGVDLHEDVGNGFEIIPRGRTHCGVQMMSGASQLC